MPQTCSAFANCGKGSTALLVDMLRESNETALSRLSTWFPRPLPQWLPTSRQVTGAMQNLTSAMNCVYIYTLRFANHLQHRKIKCAHLPFEMVFRMMCACSALEQAAFCQYRTLTTVVNVSLCMLLVSLCLCLCYKLLCVSLCVCVCSSSR